MALPLSFNSCIVEKEITLYLHLPDTSLALLQQPIRSEEELNEQFGLADGEKRHKGFHLSEAKESN